MIRSLLLLSVFTFAGARAEIPGEAEKAAAAVKILDQWHGEDAKPGERFLHFVLWTPSDREAPADYEGRLTRMMKNIQDFYGKEMARLGFGARTIQLPMDEGKLKIHLIKGKHAEEHYGKSSGNEIKQECLPVLAEKGIDGAKETLVIFCNLATWDAEKLSFSHNSPYYAGGTFQGGTAWQLDSPELDPENMVLKEPMIQDGEYGRISLGKHNSIFIGGVCHELGHALGLPHCRERPDEAARGTALMGSGNRTYGDELRGEGKGSFLTLAHALRLAAHPQFTGSIKGLNFPVEADITQLEMAASGKAIEVSGVVSARPPAYAVVAYFDPDGGGDYNATTATAVPNEKGEFAFKTDALVPGKGGELRLFPLHVNGSSGGWMSQTKFRYPYAIKGDGTPDLTTFQIKKALFPIVKALNQKDRELAVACARQLREGPAKEVAESLLKRGGGGKVTPSEVAEDVRGERALTSFRVSEGAVGWGKPAYDFLPERSLLLEAGGKIFPTGIYAHAPARHRYELGGAWKTLRGTAGLAAGKAGSVSFEIKVDGKSLWKSEVLKEGALVEFAVPLSGGKMLELICDPSDDGTGSDWGLWLSPSLHRE